MHKKTKSDKKYKKRLGNSHVCGQITTLKWHHRKLYRVYDYHN